MKKLMCVIFVFLLWAQFVFGVTGIALIHGKGSDKSSDSQGAIDYWTYNMIGAASTNYKYPYVIIHYNGKAYMWDAAKTVAAQLIDFINKKKIDDLVINTHSFGGTVVRWIFSNPDADSRYRTIISKTRWVNTVSCPAKGSEAADLAGELSGSWLTGWITELVGQNDNATSNCTTSKMKNFNNDLLFGTPGRPALPKKFSWVSGYGLWNDKKHTEDFGLAILSGVAGMPGEDDGMVSEYSSQAVGSKWFRTEANHHHNRRNDFKPVGDAMGKDLDLRTRQTHLNMWQQEDRDSLQFGGPMVQGTVDTKTHKVVSTRYTQFVKVKENEKNIPLFLQTSDKSNVIVCPLSKSRSAGEFSFTLTGENDRQRYSSQESFSLPLSGLPSGFKGITVKNSSKGKYQLSIKQDESREEKPYAIVVNDHAGPTLTTYLSKDYSFGNGKLSIFAKLEDNKEPVANAKVQAYICKDGSEKVKIVDLNDDALNGDAQQGDGIYTFEKSVKEIADTPGYYFIRVHAQIESFGEVTCKRSASIYFHRTAMSGWIGHPKHEVFKNENNEIATLKLKVPVVIYKSGLYRVFGVLKSDKDNIAWAMGTKKVEKGQNVYTLTFKGEYISKFAFENKLHIKLKLISLDNKEIAALPRIWTLPLKYNSQEFFKGERTFDDETEKVYIQKRNIAKELGFE